MSDKRLGHLQSPQSKMPQRITLKCGDQEIQLHHHQRFEKTILRINNVD